MGFSRVGNCHGQMPDLTLTLDRISRRVLNEQQCSKHIHSTSPHMDLRHTAELTLHYCRELQCTYIYTVWVY